MTERSVLVWDAPTRLFHWGTVVLVAACYVTVRLNWMDWHAWAGDALLALLLFRLLWGLFGSDTARFGRFLVSPGAALRHLAHLHRREVDTEIGHNAAGGWMVLVMILLLFGQTLTGIYVNNDIADEGPLTELMPTSIADVISNLHTIFWDLLLAAIALHVLAILAYAAVKRQNLLRPMVTGRKPLPDSVAAPLIAPLTRAALLLTVAISAAALIATEL